MCQGVKVEYGIVMEEIPVLHVSPKFILKPMAPNSRHISHRNIIFVSFSYHKNSPIPEKKDMYFAKLQKKMLQGTERSV